MPPTAFPVVANWAACEMVSPSTRCGRSASHRPRLRRTRFCGATVRCDLGIGDREAAHATGAEQSSQPLEPFVHDQRRALGGKYHKAPDGVDHSGITSQARRRQLIREFLVSRQEHLERGTVLDLSCQRAGGAKHQLHALSTCTRKLIRHLREREVEIRGRGDRRRTLSGQDRRMADQQRDDGEPTQGWREDR